MARTVVDWDGLGTDELLRRGIAAARVGENDEARAFLAEVTAREPENADAWLWRAGVEAQPQLKREYFDRVLALRPDDPEARAGLDRLAAKYGSGVLAADTDVQVLYCTWHPDRETLLRCNRCDRPMCTECAVQHPVGLRCKECVRETRSPLYVVSTQGYVLATLAGLAVGVVGAVVMIFVGAVPYLGWLLTFAWAGVAGGAQAELVGRAAGRKRGPGLQTVAAVTFAVGLALVFLWRAGSPERALVQAQAYLFTTLIYLVVGFGALWARLR